MVIPLSVLLIETKGTAVRITTKGQVTIPQAIREKLGLTPYSEVCFVEDDGKVYLVKAQDAQRQNHRFRRLRVVASRA